MKWDREELEGMDRNFRINLINSITGIKPGNLIGTFSQTGTTNLAIFTSVFHMGSNPPLIGMLVRPDQEVRRHTLENIRITGQYTINHVHREIVSKSHYTSAKFKEYESEFQMCGLTEEFIDGFHAPFVKESVVKLGLNFINEIPIELNNTILVIGEIQQIVINSDYVNDIGYIDLEASGSIGVSGLNSYYSLRKIKELPYARVNKMPDFGSK